MTTMGRCSAVTRDMVRLSRRQHLCLLLAASPSITTTANTELTERSYSPEGHYSSTHP